MITKTRRRFAVIVAGALLAALTVVNIAPVAADDNTFTVVTIDPSSVMVAVDDSVSP